MEEIKKILREEIEGIQEIKISVEKTSRVLNDELKSEIETKLNKLENTIQKMAEGIELAVLKTSRLAASELQELRLKESKAVMKDALKEWLDQKYTDFGKWSFGALMAAILGAVIYFILSANGWTKK